ncbi:MAG: thioredoxin domain-containing protein [Kofleriaceae bacterium]
MLLLVGGACEKKPSGTDPGAIAAKDRADAVSGPVDTTPLAGIDSAKLGDDKQKLFFKLVGSLKSPCGKPQSLRVSFTTDTACKRAPFAVRYVVALLEDEGTEELIRKEYEAKYESTAKVKLDVSKAPRVGNNDALVRLVEFYDYACPHCRDFAPMLEQVTAAHGANVVEYFMMFPLGTWPDSKSAAQAALAAHAQGKFKEMHAVLFAKAPLHGKEAVTSYAKDLGLDLAKFEADYTAAAGHVELDKSQGTAAWEASTTGPNHDHASTPALYFNDRKYEGPLNPRYIGMWIEEEIAVNR